MCLMVLVDRRIFLFIIDWGKVRLVLEMRSMELLVY